jgi:hypothetical protein
MLVDCGDRWFVSDFFHHYLQRYRAPVIVTAAIPSLLVPAHACSCLLVVEGQ